MTAESPTLLATIKHLISSLNDWKLHAQLYQKKLQCCYDLNAKAGYKYTAQVNTLATTYHQRLGELQSLLSQIKVQAEIASTTSHTIVHSLSIVSRDFDKIDPYVEQLEDDIASVAQLANWAGKLDGILSPLKCLLTAGKCVGDPHNIKGTMMTSLKFVVDFSGMIWQKNH